MIHCFHHRDDEILLRPSTNFPPPKICNPIRKKRDLVPLLYLHKVNLPENRAPCRN